MKMRKFSRMCIDTLVHRCSHCCRKISCLPIASYNSHSKQLSVRYLRQMSIYGLFVWARIVSMPQTDRVIPQTKQSSYPSDVALLLAAFFWWIVLGSQILHITSVPLFTHADITAHAKWFSNRFCYECPTSMCVDWAWVCKCFAARGNSTQTTTVTDRRRIISYVVPDVRWRIQSCNYMLFISHRLSDSEIVVVVPYELKRNPDSLKNQQNCFSNSRMLIVGNI